MFDPVSYDSEADVLYVLLREGEVDHSVSLDDLRIIDYSGEGQVLGVEFINAASGVDLHNVPFAPTLEELIGRSGLAIRIFA